MTSPYKRKPYRKHKVGTKYKKVCNSGIVPEGGILTLKRNDGTSCPLFSYGVELMYVYWDYLAPITSKHILGGKIL